MKNSIKIFLLLSLVGSCCLGIIYILTLPIQKEWFTPQELKEYSFKEKSVLVLVPVLTANAYSKGGFYDYYKGDCGSDCLNIKLNGNITLGFDSSSNLVRALSMLNASMISDYDLERDISILERYDKIVVLHNEYVTKGIYDALQKHDKVFYLYPNALYAEVKIKDGVMSLYRGHYYPEQKVRNGFDWQYDNSRFEKDLTCKDVSWVKISNGYQLTCYPEKEILHHKDVFAFILKN